MTASRGRARIGVLVPFTNTNLEPDLQMMRPDGVSLHFARIGGYDEDAIPDDEQMAGLGAAPLDEPVRLLAGARPDVVLYGCTSATLTHGPNFDRTLAERIRTASGAHTVTAAGALVFALKALGVGRIGFASPYVAAINSQAIAFLAGCGIKTVSSSEVETELDNTGQGALTPDEVLALARKADCSRAEAILLSCTDMRSVEVIERLERQTGKPVVSSNQAMIYEAMKALGMQTAGHGFGRLFDV